MIRKLIYVVVSVFILMNVVAYFHASKFTHFDPDAVVKTKNTKELSFGGKVKALVFGISNPRPQAKKKPELAFETLLLKSNKEIECWKIKTDSAKGTVIIFHGYSGEKSSMLDKADEFLKMGYNTMLVDFMGSGGSEGNQTTIGFHEAQQVKTAFDHVKQSGEKKIILFGTSMGAAAILKAENDHALHPSAIIVECPFGTMLQTVKARFKTMGVPSFPMAHLLVFWGGFQNDFNAFKHNPEEYAKKISCPVLLMYGSKDLEVSRGEIDRMFDNLKGPKTLKNFTEAGHENYLKRYRDEWVKEVDLFFATLK